jgi:broad specificity phosphatase PhoE
VLAEAEKKDVTSGSYRRDDEKKKSFMTRCSTSSTSSTSSSSNPLLSTAAALLVSLSSSFLPPPPPCAASLLELPASRLQNTYWLVRAGESLSESQGRIDTNRATKQGTGAGLSDLGKKQVAEGALPVIAKEACGGGCFVYYGTVRRSEQIAAAIGAAAGLSQSRLLPEFSFLDPRGLGALEGGQLSTVTEEVSNGDASSALYRPPMGTTGTPNESLTDVLIRVTQLVSAEVNGRKMERGREVARPSERAKDEEKSLDNSLILFSRSFFLFSIQSINRSLIHSTGDEAPRRGGRHRLP